MTLWQFFKAMTDTHSDTPQRMHSAPPSSKVAVIGTGEVGATFAFALTMKGVVREIALINRSREKAEGEAMDLNHCLSFVSPVEISAGGYELCADAQVVVITAGAAQEEGESRLDLSKKNAGIMQKIVPRILEHNSDPIILMVTNPVDVLTYVALKESGLPPQRVIGSGTVLDTSRFRYLLSTRHGIDPRNVHGYIVGEHGDSELATWSRVNIAGIPIGEYCPVCDHGMEKKHRDHLLEEVKNAAYKIIERKGATAYAISLAMVRIVEAIVRDQKSVLTVSSLLQGEYDIEDVCLSLPRIVGRQGIEKTLAASLSSEETEAFRQSAGVVKESLHSAGY